jgi:predicted NUDIX family phosphoesterase
MLAVSEQELVTTDSELLQTVESTFQGIFSVNTEVQNNTAERERKFSLMSPAVSQLQRMKYCAQFQMLMKSLM